MIRDAAEADLPAILAIFNHAVEHTTAVWFLQPVSLDNRLAWLRERQARGFPVLVAEHASAVAGFASYGDFRAYDGYAGTVEHSVYVAETARGMGLGRALLDALIVRATDSGLHVMIGGIAADNAISIALHAKAGFVEAGVLRQVGRKFDRWLDLVFMQKILNP